MNDAVTLHPKVMELLCSKICHDLVSPVGAVNNGIELMRELGTEMAGDAIDLIESSVGQASARLKIFRLVYGAAGSEQTIAFADIKEVFEDWIRNSRSQVSWEGVPNLDEAPKGFGKVLLNLLILASECNPGDGSITISFENNSAIIKVEGKKPSLYEGMTECLDTTIPVDDLNPRLIHAYITGVFIKYFNLTVTHSKISDTEITFTLSST